MRKRIYFDNAASMPLNKKTYKSIISHMKLVGNPSSSHLEGRKLRCLIDLSRERCAKALGCTPEEIFFTSGASEANSWAHKLWNLQIDKRVHSSLESNKYNRKIFIPEKTPAKVYAVSAINNETGINDVMTTSTGYQSWEYEQYFIDLTSAIGHMELDLEKSNKIVGASLSGHKFGALTGVGLLYVRKDQQELMKPLIYGHQENNLRGGTENVLGIISLGIAITEATKNIKKNIKHIKELTTYIYNRVPTYRNLIVLGNPNYVERVETHNHIINITFRSLRASTAVALFDKYGVAVSAGSACNSDNDEPSNILLEEGYTKDEALRTIRVSLGHQNTLKECKQFIKVLQEILDNFDN